MGIPMGDAEFIVVENTKDVHNVIVCTLCSCYPRTVLGLPPDWYKSRNYRSRWWRSRAPYLGNSAPSSPTR